MVLETDGTRTWDMKKSGTGKESQPDTVCSLITYSSQPPKEEGRLG
jgi:hypothetical protein